MKSFKIISLFLAAALLFQSVTAFANPSFFRAENGDIRIEENGVVYTIFASNGAIGLFNSFGNHAGETINSVQSSASDTALYRVIGMEPSVFFGALNANSRIFLVNANGILFAPGSQVNVAGLTASALEMSDVNFRAGHYVFETGAAGGGIVVNQGSIRAEEGGYVALIGAAVRNEGTLQADAGTVALAAGGKVNLSLDDAGLLSLEVDRPTETSVTDFSGNRVTDTLANTGIVRAAGGNILFTARAAEALFDNVINHEGIAEAVSAYERNGKIIFDGGEEGIVRISGLLDASGAAAGEKGGLVDVRGDKIGLFENASIDVSGPAGGGEIRIGEEGSTSMIYVDPNARLDADSGAEGNGGEIRVWSDDATRFYGHASARGGSVSGNGGFIEISSAKHLNFDGTVDTMAVNGEHGTLLLDPTDLTISAAANSNVTAVSPFSPNVDDGPSILNTTTLTTALGTGNVIVETRATGSQNGDITVSGAINWNSIRTLTIRSHRNLTVNSAIANAGTGSITLNAGGTLGGSSGNVTLSAPVSTGGSLTIGALNDITVNTGANLTTGAAGGLALNAANGSALGTGNLTMNAILTVGTGNLTLTSGINGTRPSLTLDATNLVLQGATVGAVTIQRFRDFTLNRALVSTGAVTIVTERDLTLNSNLTTGAASGLRLQAAGGDVAAVGNLNLNANLSVGTGDLTLVTGANGARPSLTLDGTNLVFQGATVGEVAIRRFQDLTLNRAITSSGSVTIINTRDLTINSNITTGAAGSLNLQAADGIVTGIGKLTLNGNLSVGTGSVLLSSNVGADGTRSDLTLNAGNFTLQGATVGDVTIRRFRDFTLDRTITSSGSVTVATDRDLTINNNLTTGAASSLDLQAGGQSSASGSAVPGIGNLNLNAVLSTGTGDLILTTGANGTRPDLTLTGVNLVTQGATVNDVLLSGFSDLTLTRSLASTGTATLSAVDSLTVSGSLTATNGITLSVSPGSINFNENNIVLTKLVSGNSISTSGPIRSSGNLELRSVNGTIGTLATPQRVSASSLSLAAGGQTHGLSINLTGDMSPENITFLDTPTGLVLYNNRLLGGGNIGAYDASFSNLYANHLPENTFTEPAFPTSG